MIGIFFSLADGEIADGWLMENLELKYVNGNISNKEYEIPRIDMRSFFVKMENK